MTPLSVGLALFLPALFLFIYFRSKDRVHPEPWLLLHATYAAGMVSGYIALAAYGLLQEWGVYTDIAQLRHEPLYSISVTGTVEELSKALFIGLVVMWTPFFDEMTDGIFYAGLSALGFSTFENLFMIEEHQVADFQTLLWRSIASPFAHISFSCIWGYGVAKWRLRKAHRFYWVVLGFLTSFVMHGMYNYASESGGISRLFASAFVLVTCLWIINKWRDEDAKLIEAEQTGDYTRVGSDSTMWFVRKPKP